MDLLRVRNITMQFGGLKAINELDFSIKKGQIHGLLGPNGSGKTTCFNVISGVYKPTVGEIYLDNVKISGNRRDQINKLGIARTFQHISLFNEMTVLENVMIGQHSQTKSEFLSAILRNKSQRTEEKQIKEKAFELLNFVKLTQRANEKSKNLSYGEQRLLEITRALASSPKLIMLDEASAGMNSVEKSNLINIIREISAQGITVLMIEHDMKLAMGLSDIITVLDYGSKIAEGTPSEIQHHSSVIEAYLGKGGSANA